MTPNPDLQRGAMIRAAVSTLVWAVTAAAVVYVVQHALAPPVITVGYLGLVPVSTLPHVVGFACMVFPAAFLRGAVASTVALLALCLVFVLELVQPMLGRPGLWMDVPAGLVGVGIGFALGRAFQIWFVR